jgi:ABC-2 type transport system permease protein
MAPADLSIPPVGVGGVVRKYWKIFRVSLVERLTYRADFILATFLRFLPMLTTILLWTAVYEGAWQTQAAGLVTEIVTAPATPDLASGLGQVIALKQLDDGLVINGFTLRQMIAYLLLVHISRMFSSMPGLSTGIARDIRDGELKKYLLQPIDLIGYLLSYRAAHKVAYIATSAFPYAILFYVCRDNFDGLPDPLTLAAYVVSLLLAFVIGFFFETCLGMTGFWFLEVTSVLYVVNTLNFFVSGQMFPLDLLPRELAGVLKLLPFQYLAYFPATVFLGKVQGWDLVRGLLAALAWAVLFVVLSRLLYRRGLRHYSAYGG